MRLSHTVISLIIVCCISLVLTTYKQGDVPPCFNADEAAFGYNAYSIATTGKDEHGSFLPVRLTSFGDYKLPLYSYLSAPFVGIMGMHIFATRFLNYIVAFLLPLAIYYLTKELFEKHTIALGAATLAAISLPLHILTRHAHEAPLAVLLTTLATLFLLRSIRHLTWTNSSIFMMSTLGALFTYHPSRIFALFFLLCAIVAIKWRTRAGQAFVAGLVVVILLFGITDVLVKPERISNLLFMNEYGLTLRVNEMRGDGQPRLTHNKWTIGLKDVLLTHLTYFSPQFLLMDGDQNIRFGYPGMGLISIAEYTFLLMGFYYLYKHTHRWRFFLTALVFITPVSASLSWAGQSLTRTLFLFIPLFCIIAYGAHSFWVAISTHNKKHTHWLMALLMHPSIMKGLLLGFVIVLGIGYTWYNWSYYLHSYPHRAKTIRAWQCGYQEVIDTVSQTYNSMEQFYITKEIGQPYIFMLFGLQYHPDQYHPQAIVSEPDEYGFSQVEQFDKFTFSTNVPQDAKKPYTIIGTSNDLSDTHDDVEQIIVGTEHMFSIRVVE